MDDMKGTLVAQQLFGLGPGGALGQLDLGYVGQALKVIVARIAKVGGAKAKEHRHRAAVAAFVFEKIGAMFGAHLGARHIRAAAADELLGIEFFANFRIAARLAAIVGLLAFEAYVIRITIHCQLCHILVVRILDHALVFDAFGFWVKTFGRNN